MSLKVSYNGEELLISDDDAESLLQAFQTGNSGILSLTPPRGYGTLYVAYGPGIPVVFDTPDD